MPIVAPHRSNRSPNRSVIAFLIAVVCSASMWLTGFSNAPASADPGIGVANTTATTRCAGHPNQILMRWYFPAGDPIGLVWLQHGFTRNVDDLDGLSRSYAARGMLVAAPQIDTFNMRGCMVAGFLGISDNSPFARSVGLLFGDRLAPGSALSRSLARADAQVGRSTTMPSRMIFSGHSAGGEFVLIAANELRKVRPAEFADLAGLVLLDPSRSGTNDNYNIAADQVAPRTRLRIIASAPSFYNWGGSCTQELRTHSRGFIGARLLTGNHMDAEGDTTDLSGEVFEFPPPQPGNIATLRALSGTWASDLMTGDRTDTYYPGGARYTRLTRDRVIETLR